MATTKTTTRRRRSSDGAAVAELKNTVDALIRENRTLKRQLTKLEAAGATTRRGARANPVAKGVSALARKVERALAASRSSNGRRASSAAASSRRTATRSRRTTTRKPASPEIQAKRLAALARAREARAAKKAAAGGAS
jgi:hypothetical protein